MTKVKVKYLFSFREIMGKRSESIDVSTPTVRAALEELFKRYGDDFRDRIVDPNSGEVRYTQSQPRNVMFTPKSGHIRRDSLKAIRILLNGRLIYNLNDLDTKLKSGNELTIY